MTDIKRKAIAIGGIAALCLAGSFGIYGCSSQTPAASSGSAGTQSQSQPAAQQSVKPTAQELLENPFAGQEPNYTEMTLYMNVAASAASSASESSANSSIKANNTAEDSSSMLNALGETKLSMKAPIKSSQSNSTSYMNAEMNMDIMGITANATLEQYAVVNKEKRTLDQYIKTTTIMSLGSEQPETEETGWQKTSEPLTSEDMDMMTTITSFADIVDNATVTETDTAYIVKGTISSDNAMSELVNSMSTSSYGTSTDDDATNFGITLEYEKNTKMLKKITLEYDAKTLAELEAETSIKFDTFDVYFTIDRISDDEEVIIPQEVITAANAGSNSSSANGTSNTNRANA